MSERGRRPGMFEHERFNLLFVLALIAIPAAIAIPLYNNIQQRARIARAEANVKTIANAVEAYRQHMGRLPSTLAELASRQVDTKGLQAGPFLPVLPVPPAGWSEYRYEPRPPGMFAVSATGDSTTARAP